MTPLGRLFVMVSSLLSLLTLFLVNEWEVPLAACRWIVQCVARLLGSRGPLTNPYQQAAPWTLTVAWC